MLWPMTRGWVRWLLWVTLCCMLPALASATEVRASLDRNKIELGETVTLNLRVEGGGLFQAPDTSVLSTDFAVLGKSSNTSISVINGKQSAQFTYGVALRPRHTGTITIPSLSFAGGSTQPLQLEVTEAQASAAADGRKDVYLEASIEPGSAYVGEQVMYVVRLYLASPLSNGSLDEPRVQGVELAKISDDLNYQQERNGRRYSVIERRYALIPQQAGKLDIPPVSFQGELIDMADPDSFFGSTRAASAVSQPVSLEVKAVPASAAKSAWLPARELSLTLEATPPQGGLHVGQSLNLTMRMQALGLPYEALPALSLPALDGATVYPDKPANGTRVNGGWLQGRREQSFALVPDRPGKLVIPETTVSWFNVVSGQPEVARIAAQTFDVLPAAGGEVPTATPVSETAATPAATLGSHLSWRVGAVVAIVLLLVGACMGFVLSRRVRRKPVRVPATDRARDKPAGPRQLQLAFLAAARGHDAGQQAHALLAWARAERPGLVNLSALAEQLASEAQRDAIGALQRAHYGEGASPVPGESLAAAFRDGFHWRQARADLNPDGLPPLYPFQTD